MWENGWKREKKNRNVIKTPNVDKFLIFLFVQIAFFPKLKLLFSFTEIIFLEKEMKLENEDLCTFFQQTCKFKFYTFLKIKT